MPKRPKIEFKYDLDLFHSNMEDEFLYELYEPSELMKPLSEPIIYDNVELGKLHCRLNCGLCNIINNKHTMILSAKQTMGNRKIVSIIESFNDMYILDNYGQVWGSGQATGFNSSYKYPLLESQRGRLNQLLNNFKANAQYHHQNGWTIYFPTMCAELSRQAKEEIGKMRLRSIFTENKQLKEELRLARLPPPKKPIDEEIAELQTRIMALYAEKGKN